MDEQQILVEQHGGVRLVTLNRPERLNGFTGRMIAALIDQFDQAAQDDGTGALVLTGSGRAFSAGADLSSEEGLGGGRGSASGPNRREKLDPLGAVGRLILALRAVEKPVIAAVNGVAAGGGFGLMSACDLRLASTAARFSTVFIRRGLAPDCGASYFLPRIVGVARATELFLSGEMLDTETALRDGLVSRVLPPDDLLPEALALAARLAGGPPLATQLTLRALEGSLQNTLEEQLLLEWAGQGVCLRSEDAREGIAAFLQKRQPVWKGR